MRWNIRNNDSGLTIPELMIVLPIAIIITVSLMSVLFSQYGSVLAESSRSALRSSGQALLVELQDELLFTIEYGHDLHDDLTDPHEPSGGWTYNTDPQTLIIDEAALDSSRRDENRNLIREDINDCATSAITANPIAINNVIYWVEDNPDSDYDILYKRIVTPTYAKCGIHQTTGNPCDAGSSANCKDNAKETTCPAASVGSGGCNKADSALSENVVDFELTYFETDNTVTTFPSAAEKLQVELTLGDKVFGRDIEVIVRHTIRKIN